MVRTQIQLTEAQSEQIKEVAAQNHISMAEFIRHAVDTVLGQSLTVGNETRRERAIQAAGKFHSGSRDISTRHDKAFRA
jgi:Arc/MetJ-type ribon-helix-helix transcriptional regulator